MSKGRQHLNPAQRAAVECIHGPLLVLAGAGSGKTRVVTERIAHMLELGIPPRTILAVTFTNKAAREMRERIAGLVGHQAAKELTVCTFHRFGLDVLSAETEALGLRGTRFSILDQADATGLLREAMRSVNAGKNFDYGAILTRISHIKSSFMDPDTWLDRQCAGAGIDAYDEISAVVYPKYQSMLRAMQAFDFDDLICAVVELWRARPDVLERWRNHYRYLTVDEYQDTNPSQLELVRLLATEHRNLCVVGDDDQSIYSWRGADIRNILDFERHFKGAQVVRLEENYRSTKPILDLANAILAGSTAKRMGKTLRAQSEAGERPLLWVAADAEREAAQVASEIRALIHVERRRPSDIAILYRSNQQATWMETALRELGIPLRVVGGQQFFERKEVKDVLAFLRLLIAPHDELALRRIVNVPARGIGESSVEKLAQAATAQGTTLSDMVTAPHRVQGLSAAAVEGCRELSRLLSTARHQLQSGSNAGVVARELVEGLKLREDVLASSSSASSSARRWENVEQFLRQLERRDAQSKGDMATFSEYLRLLMLRDGAEAETPGDVVTLSTIHGAKGLEWPHVFLVGLEEGFMPHGRSVSDRATDFVPIGRDGGDSVEEERRLFYVAVTRARERLYMSRAKSRGPAPGSPQALQGSERGTVAKARIPSRFLLGLPPGLIDERDLDGAATEAPEQARAQGMDQVLASLDAILGAPRKTSPKR